MPLPLHLVRGARLGPSLRLQHVAELGAAAVLRRVLPKHVVKQPLGLRLRVLALGVGPNQGLQELGRGGGGKGEEDGWEDEERQARGGRGNEGGR